VTELNVAGYLADLEQKPTRLRQLADVLERDDPWGALPRGVGDVLFVGMGSSFYAGSVAAARIRRHGRAAVAELASTDLLPPPRPALVVVAISASGESAETLDAIQRYRGRCPIVALTNDPESEVGRTADVVVPMHAGREAGGVACRSFQHTLGLLIAFEHRLAGSDPREVSRLLRQAASASADLLERRGRWLPPVRDALVGPDGLYVAAPARRLSSAQQSALVLREGPRHPAVACETGDWSHVDVYLTKTLDYRLLLFTGSRGDAGLVRWTADRGSTVVSVGSDLPVATRSVRYRGDDEDDVRLLTEALVAELLAHDLWQRP
jgi:fructoselysine-6-P-deglycase FrlB-like protein